MTTPDPARTDIIDRYSQLARTALTGRPITDCAPDTFTNEGFGTAAYTGDLPETAAQASLGCGNPLAIADIHPGDTVLDLGSGAGLDVLLSARRTGPTGRVYGLDASPDMLTLARTNAEQAGARNVEFLHGRIEDISLPDGHVDVVISNCVITLSTDKPTALAEAYRVLKPGGTFGISDIVTDDTPGGEQRTAAEHRVGCSNGALSRAEYLRILGDLGFTDPTVTFTADHGDGVHSAIVTATKPSS